MKPLLFLVIITCLFFSAVGQVAEVYSAKSGISPCSKTLMLYQDNRYFLESNCQASMQVSFGRWTTKNDAITMEPVDPKTYAVIKNVAATTVPGDSIWVSIVDENGVNITSKISFGLEVIGRGSYMFSPDATANKKFVYKRAGGKIVLRTLAKLFNQRLELATDTANNFIITLHLLSGWITSTHADWNASGTIRLLKKGKTLTGTIAPASERTIFIKNE